MAGRAAQRKRTGGAVGNRLHPGQRQVGAGAHRFPGAGGDRHAGIHRVKAQLAVDMLGLDVGAQIAHRPDQRQRVVRTSGAGPVGPCIFQKAHVARAVHRAVCGRRIVVRRNDVAQADRLDPRQHGVGAAGHFNAGFQYPVFQFSTMMQAVIMAVNSEHVGFRERLEWKPLCRRRAGITLLYPCIGRYDLRRTD